MAITVTRGDLRATQNYLNKLAKQADNNPKTGLLNAAEVKQRLGVGTAAFTKLVSAAKHRQEAINGSSLIALGTFSNQLTGAKNSANSFAATKSRDGSSNGNGKIEGGEISALARKSESAASLVRLAWALKQAGEI